MCCFQKTLQKNYNAVMYGNVNVLTVWRTNLFFLCWPKVYFDLSITFQGITGRWQQHYTLWRNFDLAQAAASAFLGKGADQHANKIEEYRSCSTLPCYSSSGHFHSLMAQLIYHSDRNFSTNSTAVKLCWGHVTLWLAIVFTGMISPSLQYQSPLRVRRSR